jgi:hypothetical protein
MSTAEERLQMIIGAYAFQVAALSAQVEQLQAQIRQLESEKKDDKKE